MALEYTIRGLKSVDKRKDFYILDWAHVLKSDGDLMNLVDLRLGSNFKGRDDCYNQCGSSLL
ncbi:unnamed protein product [Malus baccata var. baccata]|uniref:Uncharacterized protein n=1 Tax=Malus domestica TaxID=3750 RepID=A0A498KDK5_MALDO|nr:hypothetical protein DVH24_004224 [Malus domestica]